jgi:hypothetical protein
MMFQQQLLIPYWGPPLLLPLPTSDDVDIINYSSSNTPGPAGPPGPPGPQGPPGSLIIPVTTVEEDYTVLEEDYFIGVITGDSYTITLPSGPEGRTVIVKDVLGDASTSPITIANVGLIDGSATAIINTDFGSLTFVYTNGGWSIV